MRDEKIEWQYIRYCLDLMYEDVHLRQIKMRPKNFIRMALKVGERQLQDAKRKRAQEVRSKASTKKVQEDYDHIEKFKTAERQNKEVQAERAKDDKKIEAEHYKKLEEKQVVSFEKHAKTEKCREEVARQFRKAV